MTTTQTHRLPAIASEADFERAVVRLAALYGWCGYHVRRSDGVATGVHTFHRDNHADGFGWPDWMFWHTGRARFFMRELKIADGIVTRHQKRVIGDLARCGVDISVWRPADWDVIVATFASEA